MALINGIKGYRQRTIARDLIIWLTIAVTSTVLIHIAIYYFYSTIVSQRELNAKAESTAEELKAVLAIPLWNLKKNVITQISDAYLKSTYLAGIHIEDDHGRVMFTKIPPRLDKKFNRHLIIREKKIFWKGVQVGALKLWITPRDTSRVQSAMIRAMMIIGLAVFIIVIAVTHFIMKYLLNRPMERLIQGIRAIAGGDYRSHMPPVPQQGVNAIIKEFNLMASQIALRNEQLKKEIVERTRAEDEMKNLNKTLKLRIGQLTEAERALAESEKKYRGIFENALEGIFQSTPAGRFVDANPSMAAILGYDSDAELLKSVTNIEKQHYTDPGQRKEILQLLKQHGSVSNYECRYFRKDKSKIWGVLQVRAIYGEDGEIELLEGILHDITKRKALQAEAMRNARLASLGELAAGVAHEINNPINGIINYAQILINRSRKQKEPVEIPLRIIKEGERIERIVRGLLSFGREGRKNKYAVRIHDLILETLDFITILLKKDHIHIDISIPETLPVIKVNAEQIQQVFLNIISNARYALNRKYTAPHPDKILTIGAGLIETEDAQHIRVTFKDNGTGIASDVIDRICDPFFSTKPPNEGTGLGLSISHGIIKDHNGKLWAASEPGEYTKVIAELPL